MYFKECYKRTCLSNAWHYEIDINCFSYCLKSIEKKKQQ